jgi:DNA-binding transcriptional MerR regulator
MATMSTITIDELSARSGLPVTTLRMYQQRKLLSPPERRGRVGYYDESHIERLTVIGRLQGRGYSLASIVDLLGKGLDSGAESNGAVGAGLRAVLGDAVPALLEEAPISMTLSELFGSFPVHDFSLELVARVQALGLIEVVRDGVVVKFPSFLRVGHTLAGMGVPAAVIIDSYVRLRDEMAAVAADFAGLFDTHIKPTPTGVADMALQAQQLENLANAAVDVVSTELRRALRAEAETRLGVTAVG